MRSLPLLLMLVLSLAGPAAGAGIDDRIPALETYLDRLENLGFAGSVLVAEGDRTLLASGYGLADRATARPWTPQTVSTIGSITKQFTGAAILALSDDGRLSVSDPITKYFSDVPSDKQSITLHQLLTHSSGIMNLEGVGDFDAISRDEFVRRAMAQELAFPPGEGYEYSNAGYSLLGAIIEQLTGASYETFVRERFFLPAGMKDTGYILPDFDMQRVAQGYEGDETWGTVLEHPMADDGPYWVLRANGGIHSTVEDMNRWAQYLLSGKALSPASMKAYWSPQVDEGGGDSFYGYGWVVIDKDGTRIITHNGGNGIFFADMLIVPASGVVVVLQCNVLADFRAVNQMLQQIGAHLMLGEPLPGVPDVVKKTRAELERYAGGYALAGGGSLNVTAEEGFLDITADDSRAFSALFSTRPGDPQRAAQRNEQIETIVSAWLRGDVEPLWDAYGERVTMDRLRAAQEEAMAEWAEQYGAPTSHRVLGTAFREEDVTMVRVEFERGYVDRLY
ncbi:MAG: beta-lactamase family protein, partial [Candidatus Krumholzibacteria bacterium]|nr:beta-lactamase family protein [Candidatus Krumholzibacteria bacterium]